MYRGKQNVPEEYLHAIHFLKKKCNKGIVKVIDGLRKEKKTLYQLHFCKQNVKRALGGESMSLGVCIALDFLYSSFYIHYTVV